MRDRLPDGSSREACSSTSLRSVNVPVCVHPPLDMHATERKTNVARTTQGGSYGVVKSRGRRARRTRYSGPEAAIRRRQPWPRIRHMQVCPARHPISRSAGRPGSRRAGRVTVPACAGSAQGPVGTAAAVFPPGPQPGRAGAIPGDCCCRRRNCRRWPIRCPRCLPSPSRWRAAAPRRSPIRSPRWKTSSRRSRRT